MQIRYIEPHLKNMARSRFSSRFGGVAGPAGGDGVTAEHAGMGAPVGADRPPAAKNGTTGGVARPGYRGIMVKSAAPVTEVAGAAGLANPIKGMGAGPAGPAGAMGARGPAGSIGPTGPTGPTGVAGADGSAAVIPFASGGPFAMTTIAGGLAGIPGFIAFGSSAQGAVPLGASIDLSVLPHMAVILPRNGTINSLAAFFSTTVPLALAGSTVVVNAQVYESEGGGNLFTPVSGAGITLSPAFADSVGAGGVCNGVAEGLAIPVRAGSRLLMVFYITAAGASLVHTVIGHASAGISLI